MRAPTIEGSATRRTAAAPHPDAMTDEKREQGATEAEKGGKEEAAERGEDAPNQPRKRPHASRVCAGHVEQVGVVDHGPHLRPQSGHPEEGKQSARRSCCDGDG